MLQFTLTIISLQNVIVIQKAQLQTFVMWKLVNAFAKKALVDQDVINVHLDILKINTYLSSNASHVVVLQKDQPQKFVIPKMANVNAKKMFQEECVINVNLISMNILVALVI